MPKPPIDMLGREIGRLTVVKKLGKRPNGGGQEWLCHCDCGREDYVATTNSLNRKVGVRSCGCYSKEVRLENLNSQEKEDLTGRKIGRLLIVKEVTSAEPGRHWLCFCECGNEEYVTSTSHLNRKSGIKSCGCYGKELVKELSKKYTRNATKEMYQIASEKMKKTMKANNELVENTRISIISNQKLRTDNKSGYTGVTFKDNKWLARITVSKVEHYLGSFDTKEEAIAARIDGEEQYFKPLINKYKK